jgi:hypothetical protein
MTRNTNMLVFLVRGWSLDACLVIIGPATFLYWKECGPLNFTVTT